MFLLVVTAGCTVNPADCDPSVPDASALVKARCLYSGEYERRAAAKQQILEEENRLNELFNEVYKALQSELTATQADLDGSTSEHQALNDSVKTLLKELSRKGEQRQNVQAQMVQVEKDLEALKSQPGVSAVQRSHQLSDLQVKINDLQQSVGLR